MHTKFHKRKDLLHTFIIKLMKYVLQYLTLYVADDVYSSWAGMLKVAVLVH